MTFDVRGSRAARPQGVARGSPDIRGTCLIVGPDGSGKSTIALAVGKELTAAGVPVRRANPRPGILRPAPMGESPVRDPHGNRSRSTLVSLSKLVILLLDFWLGYLGPWRRASRRGVLLLERGWYDQVVDGRRYRLHAGVTPVTRFLGRFIPRADCVVVAGGSVDAIYDRCREISREEVERQLSAWSSLASVAGRRVVSCDTTSNTPEACARAVLAELRSLQRE